MVFYYSYGKKTKIFAESLGEVLGCEVYELESDLNSRGKFGFFIKALSLAFTGKGYPVSNIDKVKNVIAENSPKEIFLCAPIWGGQMVGSPRYFLESFSDETVNLKNVTVNLLLTASVPVEKYKQDALEFLNKIPCIAGEAYIFAASSKVPPEKETIMEHLREILKGEI